MKKKGLFFFLCFLLVLGYASSCHAQVINQNTGCFVSADSKNDKNYKYTKIYIPKTGLIELSFSIKFKKETSPVLEQGLGYRLYKLKGNNLANLNIDSLSYNDISMLESIELNETGIEMDDFFYNKKSGYVYSHKVTLDNLLPGYYAIEFFNGTGYDWNLNYKVSWHSGFAQNLSIPSNVSLKAGTNKTINMLPIPADSIIGINGINVSKSVDVEINGNRLNISANTVGAYTLKLRLLNGKTVSIKINVTKPDSPKLKYTTYKLNTGNSFTNKLLYTSKKVTWSSSNKKVATVSRKGKITAKGPGNCKIYAKIGKKKYICTVKVIRQQPDFYACITDYNRAGNYFKVRIKNNTKKSLIIYSSNAKAIDSDYSSFNRKLRLKNNKNITIKAKKETTIKFYVRGHRTWPNYNDFSILYSVKFDGKTYKCNTGSFWSEYVGSEKPTYKNAPQYYTWAE